MAHAPTYPIPQLPLAQDVESKQVLRAAGRAHRYLAELKGTVRTIPNEHILINTLTLLQVSRPTASNYLSALVEEGLLTVHKLGRSNYYINHRLVALLQTAHNQ